jgi:hypothetical protein
MVKFYKILMVLLVVVLFGCGTQDGADVTDAPDVSDDPIVTDVAAVQVFANPQVLGFNETSEITVNLYNEGGQHITDSNVVTFSLSNRDLASMIPIASTSTGILNRTLTAGSAAGTLTVTATSGSQADSVTIQIVDENQAVAGSLVVTANPTNITVGGTAIVQAEVLDTDGAPMPDGTVVNFSIDNSGLGSIVASATTSNGIAQATFSASDANAGTVVVTAESGLAPAATVNIGVLEAEAGSIEFVSATPQIVVIKGAGGLETSVIEFLIKDSSGAPIAGSQTVQLTLSGPNGGEYIGPDSVDQNGDPVITVDVGTVDGVASTILHSGIIPGTVTINATVVGTLLETSSGVLAIGGGTPSAGHFSLSTEIRSLEGLSVHGLTTEITARIADRYGNYNVLEGTSVSFYSECGAIDRAVNLSATGEGKVIFRTQFPNPQNLPLDASYADDVAEYLTKLGVTIDETVNPRNGKCTIVAVVDGEEEFTDSNGSGVYEVGEAYADTYDDVHMDKDDDPEDIPFGAEGVDYPFDPAFEDLVVDRNGDGLFNGMNGQWDSNKRLAKQIDLVMTGRPGGEATDGISVAEDGGIPITEDDTIVIADGADKKIYFAVHDQYYNPPIDGTAFKVTADVGTLIGKTEYTYVDTSGLFAPIFSVVISDATPLDVDPPESGTFEISWTWKEEDFSFSVPVEVD